jgi:hypothetical protein
MHTFRIALLLGATLLATGLAAPPAFAAAKQLTKAKAQEANKQLVAAQDEFGIQALLSWQKVGRFVVVVLGAAALGAVLAYHPATVRRTAAEDVEKPKTLITYTVVGSMIAIVVATIPYMAFAIFGIGGLTRFRTVLGAPKETGRVILATVVGLLCGLELWMAAIVGTGLAWGIIYLLESRTSLRMVVRGVRSETIAQSAEEYGKALHGLRCRFGTPRKNPGKGQVSFYVDLPRKLSPEAIEAKLGEEIPKDLRGTIDWADD